MPRCRIPLFAELIFANRVSYSKRNVQAETRPVNSKCKLSSFTIRMSDKKNKDKNNFWTCSK